MLKLLQAFSFASRSLRQRPAYFLVCVVLLAFTTGALSVMAALVEALLLRTPSAQAPEELQFLRASSWGLVNRPLYTEVRERNRTFSELVAFDRVSSVHVRAAGRHVERGAQGVSGNFFSALGLPMLRGRGFVDADDRQSGPNVVVLAEELSRELGVDVGGSVEVNVQACTVVGILPAGYEPLERGGRPQVFVPAGRASLYREAWLISNQDMAWLRMVGRLRPGVSAREALDDVQAVSREWEARRSVGAVGAETRYELEPAWRTRLAQDVRSRTAVLLSGAVMLLFVLACTNLYGLTRLRWFSRRRDVALRLAIGATHVHIAAWQLGELCGVLVVGVALGAVLGSAVTGALSLDPELGGLFVTQGVELGWSILAGTVLMSVLGIAIVWVLGIEHMTDGQLQVAVRETASAPRQRRGLISLLMIELALALGLVVLCFSFVSTLRGALARDLGFQTQGVYYAPADVHTLGWFNDRPRSNAFYQSIVDRLMQAPRVKAAGLANHRPLVGSGSTTVWVDGQSYAADGRLNLSEWMLVSPTYFDALGIHFLRGRSMTREEMAQNADVAVVNAAFERRFIPDGSLGKSFVPFDGANPARIIGVVADVPTGLETNVGPQFYLPYTTTTHSEISFFVQLEPDAPEAWHAASRILAEMWPNGASPRLYPVTQLIDDSTGDLVTGLRVATWVALLAGLVVACGVYFFSAFVTAQTLRESAVRIALGATLWQLMREHVWRYRRGVYGGLGLGTLLVVFVFVPVLESLQVALTPPGVLVVLAGALVLAGVALVGLCAPLLRLRRLDVVSTLNASEASR